MEEQAETALAPEDPAQAALLERFVDVYSAAQERGARYWRQWTGSLPPLSVTVLEGLADELAQERGISLERARARVAAEKIAGDMGDVWIAAWLAEHDARQRKREAAAERPLQPMTSTSRRKRG